MREVEDRDPTDGGLDDEAIGRIRRILYLNGLRGADIDDGVQEVRLRVLGRAPADVTSIQAWAAVVATNLAIDRSRADRRRGEVVDRLRLLTSAVDDTPDVALREAIEPLLRSSPPTSAPSSSCASTPICR